MLNKIPILFKILFLNLFYIKMKNTFILIFCLLSLGLKAQKITVGTVAQMNLPNNTRLLNSAQILANPNGLLSKADIGTVPKTFYEKDGVVMAIWEIKERNNERTLEFIQKESAEMFKLVSTIHVLSSVIKPYNGTNYLIMNIDDNGQYYYRIISELHNDKAINGFVKYRKEDQTKAIAILTELLNNTSLISH